MVNGHKSWVKGHVSMVNGQWSMVDGQGSRVNGQGQIEATSLQGCEHIRSRFDAAAQRAVGHKHVSELLAREQAELVGAVEHALDGKALVRVPTHKQ